MDQYVPDQVDRLIDERPGKELLQPVYDDEAVPLTGYLYRSSGHTNAYMLLTDAGRVIVNTGLGYEAVHHRALFDKVCEGPTPYIITTQAHTDHVGGVAAFRARETVYVAQQENPAEQHADARIRGRMRQWSSIWFDLTPVAAGRFASQRPDLPMTQDTPAPDLTFNDRLGLRLGGLDLELWHGTGETLDGAIVWLPQHRVAIISNLLGPLFCHFPNLNTIRGHKYRFAEPYLATVRRLRDLHPDMLVTGRGDPVTGAGLIDACLARMHDAVDYVHKQTLRGINEGAALPDLIKQVQLPRDLRVGQGYGKVSWGVRTIWESYLGWFKHDRTSALLPIDPDGVLADLVGVAGGEAVLRLAGIRMQAGQYADAIALAEAVIARDPANADALRLLISSHQHLLDDPATEANFWLSGWVTHQIARFTKALEGTAG